MSKSLSVLCISLFFWSCSYEDYHDGWKTPKQVQLGKYHRNLDAISNPPELEIIELVNDSVYRYYYKDALRDDTIDGTYTFKTATGGSNNYAYLNFEGFSIPHRSESDQKAEFTGLYGAKENTFYIDPSPELESDQFVLKK